MLAGRFTFGSQTLTVPEGFVVERVADAPLVNRPIEMDFDSQGRLYVSDSSGSNDKPEKQLVEKPHRVVRLEDTNGDGVYDKQSVFADRMMFPEGVMWHEGSLYVGAPPSIWKLTDTNDDGVADQRTEWFQGKTLTGCANDLHGPYLGPDGWFYWCKGAFATQKHALRGKPDWSTRAAHIFRARPDGTDLEPVMTGGMDNPVEVAFTPGGERLFTTTFVRRPEANQRDAVVHAIYGGLYGKPNDVLNDHPTTGELMPVMSLFGAAAPCGLTRYRSEVFGKNYRDNFFATLFNLHKVTRHALTPEGSTFKSETTDFLTSDNPDFHPTDVLEDADGSLLILDTGGWYKMCCPTSQLAKPDVFGAIYRVRRQGSVGVIDPRGLKLAWTNLKPEELVLRLNSNQPFIADRAVLELARLGPVAVPALQQTLSTFPDPLARSLAVWTLTRINSPEARKAVRSAINDTQTVVAASAIHSVSLWRDPAALPALVTTLRQGPPEIQRVAAEALGRIGDPSVVPSLLQLASQPHDRPLEHSIIYALIELNDPVAIRQALANPTNAFKTQAALIALDQMPSGKIQPREVLSFLEGTPTTTNASQLTQKTARWVANRHSDWGAAFAAFFKKQIMSENGTPKAQSELARFVADLSSSVEVQTLLAQVATNSTAPVRPRALVLESMTLANLKVAPEPWSKAVTTLLSSPSPELLAPAIKVARWLTAHKNTNAELNSALFHIGSKTDVAPNLRLGALSAIPGGLPQMTTELFSFLLSEIEISRPVLQKKMASEILARTRLTDEQLKLLSIKIAEVGPMELTTLLSAFDNSTSEPLILQLIQSLGRSKSLSSLRPEHLKPRFAKFSPVVQTQKDALIALITVDVAEQKSRLETLFSQTKGGDVRRGQTIFNSTKAACSTCHAIGYLGGEVGPDLTSIGTIRTELDLLESIVFPSASFVRSYEPVRVTTQQGDDFLGIIESDSPETLVLVTGPETQVRINRSDITDLRPGPISLMPQGLDQQLTMPELADLLAFLKNTK